MFDDKKLDDTFIRVMDDLVIMAEQDSELKEGLTWIDNQAQKNGNTFYEQALFILQKHVANKKAKEWYKEKFG